MEPKAEQSEILSLSQAFDWFFFFSLKKMEEKPRAKRIPYLVIQRNFNPHFHSTFIVSI